MAAKRSASDDLNHDNWDREETPEEMGTFMRASDNTLKSRVIKTAKRRNPISMNSGDNSTKNSAFASFSGFSSKPASSDFSFLKNISQTDSKNADTAKTNGLDKKPSTNNIFGSSSESKKPTSNIFGASTVANNTSVHTNIFVNNTANKTKSGSYYSKLKGLNESVVKWITKKVEENPLISLTPIFKDYEKYLEEIENLEKTEKVDSTSQVTPSFDFMAVPDSTSEKPGEQKVAIPQFKFGVPTSTSAGTPSFGLANSTSTASSFTLTKPATTNTTIPTFSFGSTSSSSSLSSSSGFSFGGAASSTLVPNPLAAVNSSTKASEGKNGGTEGGEDEEDQPPKVEFTPVIEKDHLYTIRCKVFVKKENEDGFADRGIGNLFLKPVEGSEKVQLIVRADTNLGNLLCNFILSDSIPLKRMGKKDVMLVTLPLPDSKPPPVPILLRVKSSEDADKLLAVLQKHKK